jgi:hypothetical protein
MDVSDRMKHKFIDAMNERIFHKRLFIAKLCESNLYIQSRTLASFKKVVGTLMERLKQGKIYNGPSK